MLQADQLKLGNVVKYKKGHLAIIQGIWKKNDNIVIDVIGINDETYINGSYEISHFYGIEITEDILISSNFEKLTPNTFSYNGGASLIVYLDNGKLSVNFWQGNEKTYFHQVQNFIFELVGKQLNYQF